MPKKIKSATIVDKKNIHPPIIGYGQLEIPSYAQLITKQRSRTTTTTTKKKRRPTSATKKKRNSTTKRKMEGSVPKTKTTKKKAAASNSTKKARGAKDPKCQLVPYEAVPYLSFPDLKSQCKIIGIKPKKTKEETVNEIKKWWAAPLKYSE